MWNDLIEKVWYNNATISCYKEYCDVMRILKYVFRYIFLFQEINMYEYTNKSHFVWLVYLE